MRALPNKHNHKNNHKTMKKDGNRRTPRKEFWKRNVDSKFQIQLEEDVGDSINRTK